MRDVQIIGGGPAGLSAAVYAARAGLSVRVFDSMGGGGQIAEAAEIENYLGTGRVSGKSLAEECVREARAAGAEILTAEVTRVLREESGYAVLAGEHYYRGRTLILANGAAPRHLGVEGERELLGRGVSYCALCDGRFFGGRSVAVVGGGNSALSEALYLSGLCAAVHIIHRRASFRGEAVLLSRLRELPNVIFHTERRVLAIRGREKVERLVLGDTKGEGSEILPVSAVFVAVGRAPRNEIFSPPFTLDADGYVETDATCRCAAPGLFAAGDTRHTHLRQISTAVADGAQAAEQARLFLRSRVPANFKMH